jgi:hypothetical protein
MLNLDVDCLTVVDDTQAPVGLITDREILFSYRSGRPMWGIAVREVMSLSLATLNTAKDILAGALEKSLDATCVGTLPTLIPSEASAVRATDQSTAAPNRTLELFPTSPRKIPPELSGRIEAIPLPDLLQLFLSSRRSGVLSVSGAGHEGQIHLRNGQMYYCIIDDDPRRGPRKSFFRIIAWEHGSFELFPPDGKEFPDELDESTEALLLDALRQLDEQRELQKKLPPATASLVPARPLAAPPHELAPEQLDVLQLALKHTHLGAVLENSGLTDRDTCGALLHLLENDYLRVA